MITLIVPSCRHPMDVKHPLALLDALHRALLHARPVADIHARLGDHVLPSAPPSPGIVLRNQV